MAPPPLRSSTDTPSRSATPFSWAASPAPSNDFSNRIPLAPAALTALQNRTARANKSRSGSDVPLAAVTSIASSKKRAKWTLPSEELFFNLLVEKRDAGKAIGGNFKATDWEDCSKLLADKGYAFNANQCHSRYKAAREKWKRWKTFSKPRSGWVWSFEFDTLTAEDHIEADYFKAHPTHREFRRGFTLEGRPRGGIKHREALERLLGDSLAVGKDALGIQGGLQGSRSFSSSEVAFSIERSATTPRQETDILERSIEQLRQLNEQKTMTEMERGEVQLLAFFNSINDSISKMSKRKRSALEEAVAIVEGVQDLTPDEVIQLSDILEEGRNAHKFLGYSETTRAAWIANKRRQICRDEPLSTTVSSPPAILTFDQRPSEVGLTARSPISFGDGVGSD